MSTGEIFVIGITHRTAPLGVRERLALSADAEAAFARDLADVPGLAEFVILNTCNRVEIYGVAREGSTVGRVAAAFCLRQGVAAADFDALHLDRRNHEALRHLFAVAAGLDSQLLGENEIFGQVKKAYATAQARGAAGALLNRVFQKTFQAVKQVRTATAITAGLVSVANVAVDLALTIFGERARANILLLGAGDIGRKCGRAFLSRGANALTVTSRRLEHAAEAATELGGRVIPFEECTQRLAEFDVVVCATAAPGTVISADAVTAAMAQRQSRPLFFIDTALPRDVEPAVAQLSNVYLYDLDDLARIAAGNLTARQSEVAKCEALLSARVAALWPQVARQLAAPAGASQPTPDSLPALALAT